MRIFKHIILLLAITSGIFFIGCSSQSKYAETFETYKEYWLQNDFSAMYEMLNSESKNYIDEDTFTTRYSNIYSAMEMADLNIEINGELIENENFVTVPFTLKGNTIAGELSFDTYKLNIYKEDDEYKIDWDESLIFPNMTSEDKVLIEDYEAKRGKILDRNDKILAEDGEISVIGIYPAIFDLENKDSKIEELANTLDINKETIINKLNENSNPEYFVPIVDILSTDEKLTSLLNRDTEGIVVNKKSSRVYYGGNAFGRLIGYIGNITSEELEENMDKGYTELSLIGKAGLEQVYEDTLRGYDGCEIYLDRNGEHITIAKKDAIDGNDIKLAIDFDLQNKAYSELNNEKGTVTAVDPKTGEVLALVSAPSYDSNTFMTYVTKTKAEEWENTNYTDQVNRFSNIYSPGSTMKLITGAIGLNTGAITADEKFDIQGSAWQKDESWGTYKITRVVTLDSPMTLREAAKFSDNIYFGQVALKIGSKKLIEGIKKFGIGEEIPFDYPLAQSSISNSGELNGEILLADTGYGQGELMVTPLNIALAYSSLANEGNIMTPRLVINNDKEASIWKEKAINPENIPVLIEDFSATVNDDDGPANNAKIPGINLAAKTGTAEIKASQDDENGTENGWFVAVDTTTSKISVAMMIEDVKDRGGSTIPIPKVKNIIEYYLNNN